MSEPHHCPGCGVEQRFTPRYPWHFCNDCRRRATDAEGRALRFGNTHVSGGLYVAVEGEDHGYDVRRVVCLIAGRPVLVTEARFGGVVAQPLTTSPSEDAVDLRRDNSALEHMPRIELTSS